MTRQRVSIAIACVCCLIASACGIAANDDATICTDELEGQSVARRWDEAMLEAIRRDTPAPTVHARNLFHTSAAMWDAWAAYDNNAEALFFDAEATGDENDRMVSISYAAHAMLTSRYRNAVGGTESLEAFDVELEQQCLNADPSTSSAAELGVAIAQHILEQSIDDGSFELDGYLDLTYMGANPPLVVAEPGANTTDPDRWQPLQLAEAITQNEQAQVQPLQFYIGPHWGSVTSFALPAAGDGLPIDPGPPPRFDTDPAELVAQAVQVITFQEQLDTIATSTIDAGPSTIGDNSLGTNDGDGYAENPATGEPYAPNPTSPADFGRVVAEFWADGPSSETPPGHWNTVANLVSDDPAQTFRFEGNSEALDRLEWDVKLYLTLNGAMHDSAIAAWGAKRFFDSSRPISIIRHLAELGQSTDPDAPSYDPGGLPLIDDSIELVTAESALDRHLGLTAGTIALRGWAGHETLHGDRDEVAWIDATTWVPYQLDTFVTPSFPGYVSGHSAFSRAGAEVLAAFTGSEFFPNGLGEWSVPEGWLRFDDGPSEPVTLQWATYYDAADQAGISRLYGGIHIEADDLAGRIIGATCGKGAVKKAFALF